MSKEQQLGVQFHSQTSVIGILNVGKMQYLAVDSVFCENRKNITLSNRNNTWTLIVDQDDTFRIRSTHASYYDLYAASDGFKYDTERRRVFCWGERCSVTQGFWRFESVGDGEFLIKNTEHNEYLYAADYPNEHSVFTWNGEKLDYASNPKFRWRFTNCPPNVANPHVNILKTLDSIKLFVGILPIPPIAKFAVDGAFYVAGEIVKATDPAN